MADLTQPAVDKAMQLIDAIAQECALHFAFEGQTMAQLTTSSEIWRSALLSNSAEVITVLVRSMNLERARRRIA